jgi:predicted CoA-substrate-specific enzyme activase
MITVGLDIGSSSTKGILLEDGRVTIASAMEPTRGNPTATARRVLEALGEAANLAPTDIDYLCTTGFGRSALPERDLQVSDITSSGRGAIRLFPATRHVVDIGAQSSRAMALTPTGKVTKFRMNEKCAAGAGRFVERCSKYLQVPIDAMGPRALAAEHPRLISSVCAVLAETEIINNVAEGVPIQDMLMGIFLSLAQRSQALMRYVGLQPEVTLVGGLVHNVGMARAISETVGMPVNTSPEGHYAAALGAAILGHARLLKLRKLPGAAR